jgi:hypothetical protein
VNDATQVYSVLRKEIEQHKYELLPDPTVRSCMVAADYGGGPYIRTPFPADDCIRSQWLSASSCYGAKLSIFSSRRAHH